jgi:hypothetical protein
VIFQNSTSLTFIKHITQRGFDDAMRGAGLNGTVAIPKFSSWFYGDEALNPRSSSEVPADASHGGTHRPGRLFVAY